MMAAEKKFLYFLDRDLVNLGGIESYSRNFLRFAEVIAARGYRVVVLAREGLDKAQAGKCRAIGYASGGFLFKNFFRFFNPLLHLRALNAAAGRHLLREAPDLVLCRDFLPVLSTRLRCGPGATIVFMPGSLYKMDSVQDQTHAGGTLMYRLSRKLQRRLQCLLEGSAFRVADLTMVSTDFFRTNILENYRVAPGKIVKLPVGIDLSPFQRRRELAEPSAAKDAAATVILSVARMVISKNIYRIIDVMALLPDSYQWIVVGGGPELAKFRQAVRDHNLERRIHPVGASSDTARFYAECDLFVHLSYYENFGQVLLEAMASGKPPIVLAPDGDQIRTATTEILTDEVNGFFVADDPALIAEKIKEVKDRAGNGSMAPALLEAVALYAFDAHLNGLLDIVEKRRAVAHAG